MGCIDWVLDLPIVIETLSNVCFRVQKSARDELLAAKGFMWFYFKTVPWLLAVSVLVTMYQMERKAKNKCLWAADLPSETEDKPSWERRLTLRFRECWSLVLVIDKSGLSFILEMYPLLSMALKCHS